jgi:predicted nuclease of restriction endonuclease-like (RecB) superfamily
MRNFTEEKFGCHRHEFLRASCTASKASTPKNARRLHSKFFSRNSVYDQQAKEHKESNEREREREIHYVWFRVFGAPYESSLLQ